MAPVYLRLGRFDDAVKARRNALRLNGASAEREADLGEALIGAANGIVTAEAKAAFERALTHRSPSISRRAIFLGVAAEQDGQAAGRGRDLARDAGGRASRMRHGSDSCAQALARVDPAQRAVAQGRAPRMSAAARADDRPSERAAMVRGMVERLAERLKQDGSDVEGWLRLVRAYMVLGDREQALCRRRGRAPRAGRRCRQAPPARRAGRRSWGSKADDAHDAQAAAPGSDRRAASACSALAAVLVLSALKRLDRVLQFADRRGREARRARQRASGSAGW